jgi:hypothetical protein
MSVSASATPLLTSFEATAPNLMPPQPTPPPQNMLHNTSSNGVSPEHSVSPSLDNHEEPVDDDNDNNWVDIPDNNTPPHAPSSKKVAPKQIPRLDNSDDNAGLPEVTGVVS